MPTDICKPLKILKSSIKGRSLKSCVSRFILMQTGLVINRNGSQLLDTLPYSQDVLFLGLPDGKVPLLKHPERRNILLPPRLQKRLFGSVVFLRNYVNLTFIPYLCIAIIKGLLRWQKIRKIISVQNTWMYVIIIFERKKKTIQSKSIIYLQKI